MSTPEDSSTWKRECAKASLVFGAALGGIGIGNAIGAPSEIAGITVRSQLTIGSDSTFGIGSENVRIATNYPLEAGLRVQPESVTTKDLASQIEQLSDAEALASITASDTFKHLGKAALLGGAVGFILLPAYRRRNQLMIGATSGIAVMGLAVPSYKMADQQWEQVTIPQEFVVDPPIYVSGNLLPAAARKLKENEAFYAQASLNLKKALIPIKNDPATNDLIPVIAQSDQHCNIGAARLTRTLTEGTGATTVLLGGDFVSSGWDFEKPCIDIIARYLPKHVVGVAGNHDSDITIAQLVDKRVSMLDHSLKEIDGITYYGASDPTRTVMGQPNALRNKSISQESFQSSLTEEVCERHPQVLIVHNPRLAQQAAKCADLTLSGHMHAETPPHLVDDDSVMMTMANVGGSIENTQNVIGKFKGTSTSYILYFDATSRRYTGMRRVTINIKGEASVSSYIAFPQTSEPTQDSADLTNKARRDAIADIKASQTK